MAPTTLLRTLVGTLCLLVSIVLSACSRPPAQMLTQAPHNDTPARASPMPSPTPSTPPPSQPTQSKVVKTDEQWRADLTPAQYRILREKGTERAFTHEFWKTEPSDGSYRCAGCDAVLFDGRSKFVSECGWPAFDKSVPGAIEYHEDLTHGMRRVEVTCARCGGHLGHVFKDGPTETRDRYCINGLAIGFAPPPSDAK